MTNWDWKLPERLEDAPSGERSFTEMVVRIEVENQGGAGETLKIIAAGIVVRNFPSQAKAPESGTRILNAPIPPGFPPGLLDRVPLYLTVGSSGRTSRVESNIWISRATNTVDDGSSTLTATVDGEITYPCDIAAHIMLKWGEGVASADVEISEASVSNGVPFGSGHRADEQLFGWILGGTAQHAQLVINQETTLGAELSNFMAQFPLMLYREVGDDTVYFGFYPEDSTDVNRFYSGSTAIKFHPNIDHPDADDYAKAYVVQDVQIKPTPLSDIFNRFTVRYRGYGPYGLTQKFTVTETPNDSNVLDTSSNLNDAKTNSLPGGYDPSAVCAVSQERYGVKRWMNIDAPSLHTHYTAYALVQYLLKRFTQPRVMVEATCGPEAVDLKPGHLISFSDDLNLSYPVPDYGSGAAKVSGWAFTGESGDPHKDFIVQRITRRPEDYGCETTFTCEQIMYNPRGAFWAPSDIATGTVTEHLHTDDIAGISDGGGVGDAADWTKRVGTDASQATSANRPTYESASGDLQNGYPIVRWNDTTDGLIITGYTAPTGNYVMGFVFNANSTTGTQTIYRSETTGPIVQISDGSNNVLVTDGGGAATIGASAAGKQSLVIKADSTDGVEVWRNGTSIGTDGTYTAQTPADAQVIGNRHTNNQGIDADLYEVIIITYSSDVDDDEVERLIGYLNHEWGIEGELPVSHVYRYSPPTTG